MSIISHSYVLGLLVTIAYFALRSRRNSDVLKCQACRYLQRSVLRMRANPGWGTWLIIAARKHRALAGCKHEGAVCICRTINFATKSFITNEQYEPRNAELYYFMYECVSIYISTKILNELFVFMLFWNNDYSRGLVGHMRQPHPQCGQLAPSAAGCVIFRPMDWWNRIVNTEPSGIVHRKYTGLPRRIDQNEYHFALLYIVRQVTIHILPCSFGGTPRCFDVLKSRVRT